MNILDEFERLSQRIRQMPSGKSADGIEHQYGQAYQRLVRAGLRSQLKGKYRGGT